MLEQQTGLPVPELGGDEQLYLFRDGNVPEETQAGRKQSDAEWE
jgi:hypothetical protein